jgi:hypothetical protein
LSALAQQTGQTAKQQYIRQAAIKALASFVPQLDALQTNTIVQFVLTFFEKQQWWSLYDASLDLLNACFTQHVCRVDERFYSPFVRHVKELMRTASLKTKAERVLVHAARTAPIEVRSELVVFIQGFPSVIDRVVDRVFLGEHVEEAELKEAVNAIVNAINVVPQVVMEGGRPITQWAYSAVTPLAFRHLYQHVSPEHRTRILECIILASRHQHTMLRHGAALALDQLEINASLPSRLFFVLIALLHDQEAMVCAVACRAAGRLITRALLQDHLGAVLERIIDLARGSNSTDIRIGAAHMLREVEDSEYLLPEQLQEVEYALSKLLTDVSHRVRQAAQQRSPEE